MIAYKGFDKDLRCRGFQYEVGKTYECDTADLCSSGFHACENPLDVYGYYPPGTGSRYCLVELDGVSDQTDRDTKRVGTKITIKAELGIPGLLKAHIEWVKSKIEKAVKAGDSEAVAVGDKESASAGNYGSASAGYRGSASAGESGSASAGDYGSASVANYGSASAGYRGSASAGDYGSASAGESGSASAGESGSAVSRGSSSVDKNGCAVARGNNVRVKGGIGSILVLVEEETDSCDISAWKAFEVDGEKIKADTWYCLKDGEITEVEGNAERN